MIVGFTCGSFDLLHAGHSMMLEEAKSHCEKLVVGLQSDPTIDRPEKNKPVQTLEERLTMLKSIKWVDEICIYSTESELVQLLQTLKPDVRIIGADWQGKPYTGHELPIRVVFNTRNHGYSTSELRNRVYNAEKDRLYHADQEALEAWRQSIEKASR